MTTIYAKHARRRGRAGRRVAGGGIRAFAALGARRGGGRRRGGAFSLMEVLVALGIFAVGLVAVAAVFPTAIAVQRETVRDLAGQRVFANARSLIQAMARSTDPNETLTSPSTRFLTLTYLKEVNPVTKIVTYKGTLASYLNSTAPPSGRTSRPGRVQPMLDQPLLPGAPAFAEMGRNIPLNAPKSFHALFSQAVRGYPKNIPQTDRRDYYWYPLIQAKDLSGAKPTWSMYLMIMQRQGTQAVPEVRAAQVVSAGGTTITFKATGALPLDNDLNNNGLPDLIQPGDWVLGDDGSIHRVLLAEKNKITKISKITIESPVPPTGLKLIYYAVAISRSAPGVPIRETRSPIVRIDQFELVLDQPKP